MVGTNDDLDYSGDPPDVHFERVFNWCRGIVPATIFRALGKRDDDAEQEVWKELLQWIHGGNRFKFEFWACGCAVQLARWKAMDHYRRKKQTSSLDEMCDVEPIGSNDQTIKQMEQKEFVEAHLEQLEPEFANYLRNRFLDEMNSEDAAQQANIPLRTAERKLKELRNTNQGRRHLSLDK